MISGGNRSRRAVPAGVGERVRRIGIAVVVSLLLVTEVASAQSSSSGANLWMGKWDTTGINPPPATPQEVVVTNFEYKAQ